MKFETPIKTPIDECNLIVNFHLGDLLYGLHKEGRERFLEVLRTKIKHDKSRQVYLTVDDINSALSKTVIFNPDLQEPESTDQKFDPEVKTHYLAWIAHKKYFPANIKGNEETYERKAFIGSCKVALLTHPAKIHFCLDGISLEAIRNKSSKHYKNYTSNELRFCAKNWEKVKNRVTFYYEGNICAPPWGKEDPSQWLDEGFQNDDDLIATTPNESHLNVSPMESTPGFFKANYPQRKLFDSGIKMDSVPLTEDSFEQSSTPLPSKKVQKGYGADHRKNLLSEYEEASNDDKDIAPSSIDK